MRARRQVGNVGRERAQTEVADEQAWLATDRCDSRGVEPHRSVGRLTSMAGWVGIGMALTTLALAGCSSSSEPSAVSSSVGKANPVTRDSGTVRGVLEVVGGPAPGSPRPATPGTVTLRGSSRYSVAVDGRGRFRVAVDPGTYEVTGTSPLLGDGTYLCRADHVIVVTSSKPSRVRVVCDIF